MKYPLRSQTQVKNMLIRFETTIENGKDNEKQYGKNYS